MVVAVMAVLLFPVKGILEREKMMIVIVWMDILKIPYQKIVNLVSILAKIAFLILYV